MDVTTQKAIRKEAAKAMKVWEEYVKDYEKVSKIGGKHLEYLSGRNARSDTKERVNRPLTIAVGLRDNGRRGEEQAGRAVAKRDPRPICLQWAKNHPPGNFHTAPLSITTLLTGTLAYPGARKPTKEEALEEALTFPRRNGRPVDQS